MKKLSGVMQKVCKKSCKGYAKKLVKKFVIVVLVRDFLKLYLLF